MSKSTNLKKYKSCKRKKPLSYDWATYMLGVNFSAIVKRLVITMACKNCTYDYYNDKSNFRITDDHEEVIVELWKEHKVDYPEQHLCDAPYNFTMFPKPSVYYTLEFLVRLKAQEVLNHLNLYMPDIEKIQEMF